MFLRRRSASQVPQRAKELAHGTSVALAQHPPRFEVLTSNKAHDGHTSSAHLASRPMRPTPCTRISLSARCLVILAFCRFCSIAVFCVGEFAWPSPVPPRPRSPGRFAPRATATIFELTARSTIWVINHPSPAALAVLPDHLHARTGDLARRIGAEPAPKPSRSTDPPPVRSPDDLSARPASQTLDLVPSALGRSP